MNTPLFPMTLLIVEDKIENTKSLTDKISFKSGAYLSDAIITPIRRGAPTLYL
jgi:hypothetical protein